MKQPKKLFKKCKKNDCLNMSWTRKMTIDMAKIDEGKLAGLNSTQGTSGTQGMLRMGEKVFPR